MGSASAAQTWLDAGRLSLRFVDHGDRLGHEIALVSGNSRQVVLRSVEGNPSQEWPSSPPLQSMHVEQPPGELPRALLVGMAGRSHWSASVELDRETSRLRFDVAARVRASEIGGLGAEYQTVWRPRLHSNGNALLLSEAGEWSVMITPGHEFACARLELTEGGFAIRIGPQDPSASHRTIRWTYAIAASCEVASLA